MATKPRGSSSDKLMPLLDRAVWILVSLSSLFVPEKWNLSTFVSVFYFLNKGIGRLTLKKKQTNILYDLKIVDNSPGNLKRSRRFLLFKIKAEVDVQLPALYVTAHAQAINYHVKLWLATRPLWQRNYI